MKTKKVTPVTKKEVQNLDLSKLTNEQLLEINLDEVNLYDLLEKNESLKKQIKKASKDRKDDLYKNVPKGEAGKSQRSKLRRKRNLFISNVIEAFTKKDNATLKKEIEAFNKFYKENYLLNDYSFNSLSRTNADADTKVNINLFLQILKRNK